MSNENIDIQKLFRESRETLLNPKSYFPSMPLSGGHAEPLIKAAIYGTVAGLFALLWSLTGFTDVGNAFSGGAVGIMALIVSIIGAIVGVFIGGALMLLVSAICGGNTDYEANVRVTASLMVLYPINAFFSFLSGISLILGILVGLAISLYSVYLLYIAESTALKGRESSARIVAIVLVVLALLGSLGSYRASKKTGNLQELFQEQMEEMEEME
jgi:hypothetical protein